jgi:hypothetical protein
VEVDEKMELAGFHIKKSIQTETNPDNQNLIVDINLRIRMEFSK